MRFSGKYIFLFLSVLTSSAVCQPDQIFIKNISIEQGLSQSTVFDIVEDSVGFMWFATKDGLNKYDGYNFTVYRPDPHNSESISAAGIRRLLADNQGYLWVITLTGDINRYDYKRDAFKKYSLGTDKLPADQLPLARCIVEDLSGNIWVGTVSGSLYLLDRKNNKFILKDIILNEEIDSQAIHLQTMYSDKSGLIWIGTWEGLISYNYNTGKFVRYYNKSGDPNSLGGNAVFDIAEDKAGNIWIASADGGVSRFDRNSSTFNVFRNKKNSSNNISGNRIFCVYADSRSFIWIGTADGGLDLYNLSNGIFKNYNSDNALTSLSNAGSMMCIYEDKSGAIWIGSANNGICRIDWKQQNFNNILHIPNDPASLKVNTILALCEDHNGNLWVGTAGGGLSKRFFGQNKFEHYSQLSGELISNTITAIYEDHNEVLWIGADPGFGTSAGMVISIDSKLNNFKKHPEVSPEVAGITSFYEDTHGELWIGTSFDGLRRMDLKSGNVVVFKHDVDDINSLSENRVMDICEDENGFIWIGTYSQGLNKYDPVLDKFILYKNNLADSNSLSDNAVQCIFADKSGDLWIGTRGGLNKFIPGKEIFKRFTIDDGLPGNVITGILDDDKGNLWLSTNNGLCRFNKNTFACKNFDQSDGLNSKEFIQGSYCKGIDGRLYFGGTKGITNFYPENIVNNLSPPPVVITKFSVFNKPVSLNGPINFTGKITLSYQQNFFSFEFAALDYTAPEKNQYAYLLEGVDKDWVYSGNRRYASYTDISPGEYIFHVKGSNNDGVWSKQEATIQIVITPPFWQTWWFRVITIIFFILVLYVFYRYRLSKLLEVERTRVRIAQDLHDDVSATITGMVYFSDAIDKELGDLKTPILQKLISLIHESASSVQESMSDIIWSINPGNDKWEIVLPKFRRFASDLCESKSINYEIEIPDDMAVKPLDMERRKNLWLVFKEMVSNAVKHSGCTELKISLSVKENNLELVVSDNGNGFDPQKSFEGNGVKNIQSRASSLKGEVKLTTSHGNGTKWEFALPL